MTDRQARRLEVLLRTQCVEQHNIFAALMKILAFQAGGSPEIGAALEARVTDHLHQLMDIIGTLAKDARDEKKNVKETKEQQRELERLLEEMATARPPVGLKAAR